jgi:hypothetical protein
MGHNPQSLTRLRGQIGPRSPGARVAPISGDDLIYGSDLVTNSNAEWGELTFGSELSASNGNDGYGEMPRQSGSGLNSPPFRLVIKSGP